MSEFVSRVSQYPVVGDTCKAANDAYAWVRAKESITPILQQLESAAVSLASIVKPVVESNVAQKLDDVACHQILDRFESVCPTLKESSAEELLGPVANHALNLAETCADYCFPDKVASSELKDLSRTERLSRIQTRAIHQAVSLFSASVSRARDLLSGLLDSGYQISQVIPTASIASTLAQVTSILNFACGTAKAVSLPLILQGLTLAKDQTEKLNGQLKESNSLNWLDLKHVIDGLDKLRTLIEDQSRTVDSISDERPRRPSLTAPVTNALVSGTNSILHSQQKVKAKLLGLKIMRRLNSKAHKKDVSQQASLLN